MHTDSRDQLNSRHNITENSESTSGIIFPEQKSHRSNSPDFGLSNDEEEPADNKTLPFSISFKSLTQFQSETQIGGEAQSYNTHSEDQESGSESVQIKYLTETEILGSEMQVYYTYLCEYYPDRAKDIASQQAKFNRTTKHKSTLVFELVDQFLYMKDISELGDDFMSLA